MYGSIAYLILIEAEEGQVSYLVVMALGDRVPTGPLFALDVNARTIYHKTLLLIAEGAHEDTQRNYGIRTSKWATPSLTRSASPSRLK
jgi:hypothetical protein